MDVDRRIDDVGFAAVDFLMRFAMNFEFAIK